MAAGRKILLLFFVFQVVVSRALSNMVPAHCAISAVTRFRREERRNGGAAVLFRLRVESAADADFAVFFYSWCGAWRAVLS